MDKLGVNLSVLLIQILNFGILVFILNKFLYKPILGMLAKRREKIEQGLRFSRDMEEEKASLDRKRESTLKKAREEAAAVVAEAKKQAKAEKEEILKTARAEVTHLREKMEKDLKSKYQQMAQELNEQTVEVAARMSEKVISSVLTPADHQKLIRQQLAKMKNVYGKQ